MRLLWYAGVSFIHHARRHVTMLTTSSQASAGLATGVIAYAFNQRANFYSAMVYLSQNNLSLMVRLLAPPCPCHACAQRASPLTRASRRPRS